MVDFLYRRDSLEERAFQAALALPPEPKTDWSAELRQIEETGVLPPRADHSPDYPVYLIIEWFETSKYSVSSDTAHEVSRILNDATGRLFAAAYFEQVMKQKALGSRSQRGATCSLKKVLRDVEKAATTLSSSMRQIRGELLHRRAAGQSNTTLENVHAELHHAFSYGQWRRTWLLDTDQSHTPGLLQEIGWRASLAPTWLEEGCNLLVEAAGAFQSDTRDLERLSGGSVAQASADFARAAAAGWKSVTCRPWTLAGSGPSPFQRYFSQVCGHASGLLARRLVSAWPTVSKKENEQIRMWARRLKLAPIPSASQLRRRLEQFTEPAA